MALKTKIKLTPAHDWKSILLEDITGNGITGYGANQDPASYRPFAAISSGKGIYCFRIVLTSPSEIETVILLKESVDINLFLSTGKYTVTNTDLGYSIDETIEEGIWSVSFTPYFQLPNIDQFHIVSGLVYEDYYDVTPYYQTKNATSILLVYSGEYYFHKIKTFLPPVGSKIRFETETEMDSSATTCIGIGTTLYTSITKELKECLDNKIADLSLTPCECDNCSLINKVLLYEAIELNCKENNYTKANQIFTHLTNLSTNCDC